jgi:phenylacetate-CoA ligase
MTGASAATASLARSQWLSPEALAEHQAALHARLVRRAGRRRGAFGRSVRSSGTGGSPSRARWSVEAMRWQDAAEARARDWVGAGDGMSRLWVCCNPADRLRHVGAFLGNTRIVAAGELARDDDRLSAMVEEIARRPPDVIQGVSNVLAALADGLERRDVSLPGTICISAGNHLTPWYRRRLEPVFARFVRERYAAAEVGLIASSCERGTLHVHAENLLVEILDRDGATRPPGALGEIAVTMLRNSAAPAARRRVGDIGRLPAAPCGCGRGLPTIDLLGRVSEQIRAGGRVVSPTALFEAADDPALAEACFHHRRSARSLDVAIRRRTEAGAPDLARMADRLERAVGAGTSVEIREGSRLPPASSGKLALVRVSD